MDWQSIILGLTGLSLAYFIGHRHGQSDARLQAIEAKIASDAAIRRAAKVPATREEAGGGDADLWPEYIEE